MLIEIHVNLSSCEFINPLIIIFYLFMNVTYNAWDLKNVTGSVNDKSGISRGCTRTSIVQSGGSTNPPYGVGNREKAF